MRTRLHFDRLVDARRLDRLHNRYLHQHVDPQGYVHVRSTGCEPRLSALGEWLPEWSPVEYGDKCPILPDSEIVTQPSLRWVPKRDYDQNGDPSCCLFALGNGIQLVQALNGRDCPDLDCRKAWIECTGGRGGYPIDAALVYAMDKGFPIKGSSERVFVVEAYDCGSVAAFFSALELGKAGLIFGHYVPGGHAEAAARVVREEGADPEADTLGSWGWDWPEFERGWHRVSKANLAQGIPDFGAFAIRELAIRPADMEGITDAQ
jgi:hypothetical protein